MSHHRNRRGNKSSFSSNYNKSKSSNYQDFNRTSNNSNYNFRLYENDRQDRINQIADDDDGDLIVERQLQSTNTEKPSRIIQANDRRHDAVIFGDKTIEGKLLFISIKGRHEVFFFI